MDITKITGSPVEGDWSKCKMKDDTWYDEEARSQIYNEHAEKIYSRYLDEALAFLNKHKINGQDPDERFMRLVESYIDIPEQHADDFRRSVVIAWADKLKKGVHSYNVRWHQDAAMFQAISDYMKHEHLGYPQFYDGQSVRFNTTVELAYYQEKEEEERSRTCQKGIEGKIVWAIPRSTCWYFAVQIRSVDRIIGHEHTIVEAPFSVLEDNECPPTPKFPEWNFNMEAEQMVATHEQVHADFKKNNTCTCSIDTLMTSGCKCGHLEKK